MRRQLLLSLEELWVLYVGLGGVLDLDQLADYLWGGGWCSRLEHNVLVQALNERVIDAGGNHPVAYIDSEQ